ncbi:unnamed protein product [Boreogadus saida]
MCPPNDKSSIIVLLQLSERPQEPGSGWHSEAGSANTHQPLTPPGPRSVKGSAETSEVDCIIPDERRTKVLLGSRLHKSAEVSAGGSDGTDGLTEGDRCHTLPVVTISA